MNAKKTICLFLTLFMLVFLSACGSQQEVSDSGDEGNENSKSYQTHTETNNTRNDSRQIPTEAEIQAMLNNGDIDVFWAVEEDTFSLPDTVSAYKVEAVDGDAVWNALFSQNVLVSRHQFGEYSEMLITLDGTEYTGRLYNTGLIEFGGLSEFPTALSSNHLMDALSGFTGMDWNLGEPDDTDDTSTYYQFSVDRIVIDRKGYSVGENRYPGPFAAFDSSYVSISVPFRLGTRGDTLVSTDLVSLEQAKTLCRTDFLAQCDYPQIIVFDHAELVYYYQAQQQMLLPAWRITGTSYGLSDDGALSSGATVRRLIDAQTGELFW